VSVGVGACTELVMVLESIVSVKSVDCIVLAASDDSVTKGEASAQSNSNH
jgi:hypothetical protein